MNALKIAREKYKEKMNRPHISEEVDGMSDEEFLTKIKLMVDGRITNAAMLLLGNEDKDYLFASAPEAAWRVYNSKEDILDDKQKDYKIRNLLASMKKAGIIKTDSENQQRSYWILDK